MKVAADYYNDVFFLNIAECPGGKVDVFLKLILNHQESRTLENHNIAT
jgi:hypothetical protein